MDLEIINTRGVFILIKFLILSDIGNDLNDEQQSIF
ncbi:hypothetical protein DSM03_1011124 [Leeuwenhoekiella aestuarii]|uniref:Uncharacterized protein n=2 Tax=Leeuwenhoekiella TaxID=283735 RepID=A0A4Q0P0W2_9FLAO|nr:hypothetical protein DSM04_101635 [Leeuwenhoekiella aestuarii]RXG19743.1 hypothetical protein DSM03_1011124 [Leeuwenhoekiella aestuarii]RXG25837.1 hypothetical protein DSM02_1007 [Leeuwenhoekiella polynyae]